MTEKDDLTKPSSALDLQTLNQTATWFIRSDDSKSSKRNKAIPCARWGHASAAVDNNYYVYGGTGDKANPIYWESIYRLDVETWEWINLEAGNKPPTSRDSHSMTICKNKLYIFGGSCDSESRNDLYEYDLATTTWKQVEVKGSQPTPREGHSTCLYEDKYLVVYGGWNGEETLNDCYLFDIAASTWIKVEKNVGTEPTPRESQSCCLIQNHMYLFGGQGNSVIKNGESVELFLNDLYRFKIVVENGVATATWEKLEPQGTNIPPHRSSHSITTYKNRYMFIVGGEGYPPVEGMTEADLAKQQQNSKNKDDDDYSCFPKNDVWYYDIEQNKWNNIKMKNGAEFVSRFAHSCNVYKDYLIVFGGLRDYHHSTSDICVLSLDGSNPFVNAKAPQQKAKKETKALPVAQEADKNKGQIPNKGGIKGKTLQGEFNLLGPTHHGGHTEQAKETMDESITELEGPLVSTSFLHSLSSIISWPLAAFGLLLDNALINRAANLRIEVQTRKRKSQDLPGAAASDLEITYIVVEDDGKGWKHNEFINIFMKYDTDPTDPNAMLFEDPEINQQEEERRRRLNEYAFNLKVAGFRLGRTIIYISRSDDEISIGFISVDKRYNPDIHGNHVFLYSWKRGTQEFLTSQGQKNKDIIMNALAGIFSDEDFLQNIDKYCNRVFIMDLNPVATSKSTNGKSQDFELLLPKKGAKNNDIMVRTLDKNLKSYYTDQNNSLVELSLRTYFSYFFLDPSQANIEIYINDSAVSCANLKEVTEDRTNQTGIQKFKEEGLFDACFLQPEAQKDETSNKEQKEASAAGNKRKSRNQKSSDKSDFNQGVLVYFNNRLIRRLETPKLGNLDFLSFQSRQVQNKPGASLFSVNGYIEVKPCLKPNMFKTEIENPYYSNYLYSVVIPKLQSGSNLNENDKRKLEGANEEYDAVTKKVKTNPV